MSTALVYRAFRATPLSHEESQAIDIVIARYQSDFEYRDEADAIQSDPPDPADPERICSGAIVLTDAAEDGRHWADCLTDIRRVLEDAVWQVFLGGQLLAWDEDDGWMLPKTVS